MAAAPYPYDNTSENDNYKMMKKGGEGESLRKGFGLFQNI